MSAPLYLVVSGDPSGDVHAASLIAALKRRSPEARVAAVGGPLSRAAADEFLEDLASRGVTGFLQPVLSLRFLLDVARRVEAFLVSRRPTALIVVDYYGFNRRVLAIAKRVGVPAFYFIGPQVWASRPGRIDVLRPLVRKMLVIFPFEETLYREAGVPVEFVGHPLLDRVPEPPATRADPPSGIVGLLPGSRATELRRHLPLLFEAFRILRETRPALEGVLFAAPSRPDSAYGAMPPGVRLVRERDYAARRTLSVALCASGTATLENALLGIPMVVVYKLSWPEYRIARALIRVPHVAMANLLAGKRLVPELIQHDATPARVAAEAAALLDDPARHAAVRGELLALRASLGRVGAAERAAEAIVADVEGGR